MNADTSLFERLARSGAARYFVSLVSAVLALLVSGVVSPQLGDNGLFIILLPGVAFSAWYCGVGPAIWSTLLALLGMKYWFIPPTHSLYISGTSNWVGMLAFLIAASAIIAMGQARRRENERLRDAQQRLEDRVKERTAELDLANQGLRELSGRLLQLQDDERRRIARELHDSVGQLLVALSMNLSSVRTDIERLVKTATALTDSEALVQEMSKEVRTISHLLHPPLLDEAGLPSAVRWYINGFAERSRIKVDLEMAEGFGRLPRELETAIFRTVQECLTNIHRHSGSPTAKIRISQSDSHVRVEVEDRGKGIPPDKRYAMDSAGTPGVGLRGMRERLRQLGGSLEIDSNGKGTVIVARLPVAGNSSTAAA